ncbi:hypothetical protein [Moraxella macacae]|nr:hypothetical protein [Moraxella macacae]
MARAKLSKNAIDFIIKHRDDTSAVYTWSDIAELLNKHFGVQVTHQAVAKKIL